jgi:hypothetical protein
MAGWPMMGTDLWWHGTWVWNASTSSSTRRRTWHGKVAEDLMLCMQNRTHSNSTSFMGKTHCKTYGKTISFLG